ncbi:sensor histidine kinase [Zavarzinia aquatilis]|uniref:sensor histidine kinase n=1 Tax=Zavarzinia aquatilis TaxID=2211142 RepID=UPI001403A78D|nr:histidine kinase [Zavarzinia aquatilis]
MSAPPASSPAPLPPTSSPSTPTGRAEQSDHFWSLFPFAAALVYGFGQLVRYPTMENKTAVVLFSIVYDTVILLTMLLNRRLIQRRGIVTMGISAWLFLVPLSLVSAAFLVSYTIVVERLHIFGDEPLRILLQHRVSYTFFVSLAFNSLVLWLHVRWKENQRVLAAEREAARAEIRRLRQQLDPHFIFNGLNMIAVDIQDQPAQALAMLHEMANYLRQSLDTADVPVNLVQAEMAALKPYLEVQAGRFEPRLKYALSIDPAIHDQFMPTFLIQPLVENAVKHGEPGTDGIVQIDVRFGGRQGALVVTVANTGRLTREPRDAAKPGTRTGLANLRKRLDLHYPGRHRFEIAEDGRMVRATVHLTGAPEVVAA